MIQAINADATVTMAYDALGQLTWEQTQAAGTTSALRHAYDELGNRVQTIPPDGRVLNNLYYGSGHLHQIDLDGELITDIERDRAHRMISRTQGALVSQFQYDPVGRLLSQTAVAPTAGEGATPVIARKYEYDEVGNLVSIDDQRNGITRYSYDPIGRILSAVQPNLTERFAFDPAHNLLDTTVASVGRVEGNRIRVYEDKRYDYDEHGNVVEKLIGKHTRMRFEWNAAHQMVKSIVARNSSDTAQTVRYAYDPFGRRIAKRDAFGVTRFVWDGNRLLCEQRGAHARTYVYGEDAFVPLARIDAVAAGEAAPRADIRYLHSDHLGTQRELTDSHGQVVWAASYKVWGNLLEAVVDERISTRLEDAHCEKLELAQPLRFQGQYYDNESGLHYNQFRYYDPDIGRFISIDPIGFAGDINTYRYAPNPFSWVDPIGLSPCPLNNAERSNEVRDSVWHATVSPTSAQGVLNGVNPRFLNPESRFGAALYVAEQPGTTIAELAHHKAVATHAIRFDLNRNAMRVLDLINPETAAAWKYAGGPITDATKQIGSRARENGFNVIRFNSERAVGGVNNAILGDFADILRPVIVTPIVP